MQYSRSVTGSRSKLLQQLRFVALAVAVATVGAGAGVWSPAAAQMPVVKLDKSTAAYRGKPASCKRDYGRTKRLERAFLHVLSGDCWSCPVGYKRSPVHKIRGGKACVRKISKHARAKRHKKAAGTIKTKCPKGQFLQIFNGYCYSCPGGYKRTAAKIDSGKACRKRETRRSAATRRGDAGCPDGSFRQGLAKRCYSCPSGYSRTAIPAFGRDLAKMGDACARLTLKPPKITLKPPRALVRTARDAFAPVADLVAAAVTAVPRAQKAIVLRGVKPKDYRDRKLMAAVDRYNRSNMRRRGALTVELPQYAALGGAPPQEARIRLPPIQNVSVGFVLDGTAPPPWPLPISPGANGSAEFVVSTADWRNIGVNVGVSGTLGLPSKGGGDAQVFFGFYFLPQHELAGPSWSVEVGYHRVPAPSTAVFLTPAGGVPGLVPKAKFGGDVQFIFTFPKRNQPVKLAGIVVGGGYPLGGTQVEADIAANFSLFWRRCPGKELFADPIRTSNGPTGCFACPRGYHRTLTGVSSPRACSKGLGGPYSPVLHR